RMNSTFSSLQYTLTNRKVVNFPAPSKWYGKLIVNIIRASEFEEYKDLLYVDEKFTYKFLLQTEEELVKEVSILDVLYLFNWKTGDALDLPSEIREVISKFKHIDVVGDIQDFIRVVLPLKNSGYGDIFIEGTPWDDFPVEEMKYRFS